MSVSSVTASVIPTATATTYNVNLTHKTGESLTAPVNIGDLEQTGTTISVSDQGTTAGVKSYNFTLNQGSNLFINSDFGNTVDQITTRVQLFDSSGNLIADNQGSASQQAAYTELTSTGLTPGAGNYNVTVTPLTDAGAPDISLSSLQQQGTALGVNSQLTPDAPNDYYAFSLGTGSNLKLAFNANTNSSSVHIQLFNSSGAVIADNRGTVSQQNAFSQLTSGTGLSGEAAGTYTVGVSYGANSPGSDTPISYNFQLYSGNSYGVLYNQNVAPPSTAITAAQSVTASSDASLYSQQTYNTLNETASTAVGVGYLQQNKTSLNVYGLLTPVDATDYYTFSLQSGNNLKLAASNLTNAANASDVRVQLLSADGAKVIADSQGTPAQQAAYAQLTGENGITATPAAYVVKVSYGQGASKSQQLEYNFQLFSGTTYTAQYKTTASAQTYENAVLAGDISSGTNPATASAAYLASLSSSSSSDVASTISSALSSALSAFA